MVGCSILGCKSYSERKMEGISFHAFPMDSQIKLKWISATGRTNWIPTKYSKICSLHFESNLLTRKLKRTELFRDAIPSINIMNVHVEPETSFTVQTDTKRIETPRRQTRNTYVQTPRRLTRNTYVQTDTKRIETPRRLTRNTYVQTDTKRIETPRRLTRNTYVQTDTKSIGTPRKLTRNTNVQSDPEIIGTLTRKLKRQQILSEQRLKKLSAIRQKKRRLEKKVATLQNIVNELKAKNIINEENCELLKSVGSGNIDFIKKMFNVPGPRKYSPSLRKFALCLHFISPRAYKYVRENFKTCLPHPKTIYTWYKCIDGKPGFTTESLKCLELLAQSAPKTIFGALTLDEMAIRKHVEWDGKKSVGFVDFGEHFDVDDAPVAREALVFMLTAINKSFKVPLGYFLIDGCTGEQKAALVINCIKMVTSCGIRVLSLTFDGCASNLAMAKQLGCNLDPKNLNTEFQIDGQKVVVFPDPAHMLKLIRNTLGQKKELTDGADNKICWRYIENLHKLQDNEGLHMANKLKRDHINFNRQIMKVKLAAQTLSNSVAEAINYCDKNMCLPEFAKSDGTTHFIKNINNLFDIMNSRNLSYYGFKKPIKIENFVEINAFFNLMKEYLTNIKLNGQPILSSARKTGFLGFLMCICSVQKLFENVISNNHLVFLPTYKLSQDHLECFFSAIRAKGGFNNNPTAKQFESAYKRLVVHGEIKSIESGNCIPLEQINILNYTDIRFENKINLSTPTVRSYEESEIQTESSSDHDYLPDPSRLSLFTEEVIKYIAGFVVRKLCKIIRCEDCLIALISDTKYNGIIFQKDKGGLIYPSVDLIKICNACETILRSKLAISGPAFIKEKNVLPKLVHLCLQKCFGMSILLSDHFNESSILENHKILLIKSIALRYFELRIHHETTKICKPEHRIRNVNTKLILFQGQ